MKMYSLLSGAGMEAVRVALPDRYPMELTRKDMFRLLWALRQVAVSDVEEFLDDDQTVADWAGGFISSVAETVGVDLV